MAEHNEFGKLGEELACRYLAQREYRLLSRNFRFHHLEIDIVADYFGQIVFVEVKSRRSETFVPAELAVDREKRENLRLAALAYLRENGIDAPVRFDIITVVGAAAPYDIRHFRAAFSFEVERKPKRP